MKNKQRYVLGVSLLAILTLTSCGGNGQYANGNYHQDGQNAYNALEGVKRQATYKYYESYMPKRLNSIVSMQSEDARYITNIIDGLVDVDRTGTIVPGLAESWKFNSDFSELTLQIRQGVPWVKNSNSGKDIYQVNGVDQYVSADDWVYAIKQNLTMGNGSESYYLSAMFFEGGQEYYAYTQYAYYKVMEYGPITQAKIEEFKDDANSVEESVRNDYGVCSNNIGTMSTPTGRCAKYRDPAAITDAYIAQHIGLDDVSKLKDVANFSRVGVKSTNNGKTLTFTLTDSMPYFLSSLTYTPFFPVNESFVEALPGGVADYGKTSDNLLVCGAYIMDNHVIGSSKEVHFLANENYWDTEHVMTKDVTALQYPSDAAPNASRIAYESGSIDGFSVNDEDTDGYDRYVKGEDGKGTIDDPHGADAHAVESLGEGSTYAFILNTNRDATNTGYSIFKSADSAAKQWDKENEDGENLQILNTNKALSVSPALREYVLASLDYETYTNDFGVSDYNRIKYLVNTWTPANFITYSEYDADKDNEEGIFGNDYTDFVKKAFMDKFYSAEKYSKKAQDAAEAALGYSHLASGDHAYGIQGNPSDLDDKTITTDQQTRLNGLKAAAKAEIEAFNTKNSSDKITTPVLIEFPGLVFNDNGYRNSATFINATNKRVAGCWYGGDALSAKIGRPEDATVCTSTQEADQLFRILTPTAAEIPTSDDYAVVSQLSWANMIISGWGPDYSDPMTFANTLVTNGDLAPNTGASSDNKYFSSTKGTDVGYKGIEDQYAEYDKLVEEASKFTDSKQRFNSFAKAEIELIYNVHIIRPLYMRALGKSVSVSKTVSYRVSPAVYGVTNYKLKNVEVLTRPLSQAEYDGLKAERLVQNSD